MNEIRVVGSSDRNCVILGYGLDVYADVDLGDGDDVLQSYVDGHAMLGAGEDCGWFLGETGGVVDAGSENDFVSMRAWSGTV